MPNATQEQYLRGCAGAARHAYNWGNAKLVDVKDARRKAYQEGTEVPRYPSARDLKKEYNAIKRKEFPWTQEYSKFGPETGFLDLGSAIANKLAKRTQTINFKKKGICRDSFIVGKDTLKLEGILNSRRSGRFVLPVARGCKVFKEDQHSKVKMAEVFDPRGKEVTGSRVVRDTDGWFICINFKLLVPPKIPFKNQEGIGLDLGVKSLAIDSEGGVIASLNAYRKSERKLAKLQKVLSRKTKWVSKGVLSKGYLKAKAAVDRQHAKVRNQRKDALHKASSSLTKNRPFIVLENLHIKGMVKNKKLSKSIMDQGWGMFVQQLTYKGKLYGCEIHKANTFYPSSQLCSCCGVRNKEVKNLAIRDWTCSTCGAEHDRDVNAAKNLRLLYDKLSGESSPLVRCSRI